MNNYNNDIINILQRGFDEYEREIQWEEKVKSFGIRVDSNEFEELCMKYKVGVIEGDEQDCINNILRGQIILIADENEYLNFIIDFNKQEKIETMVRILGQYSNPKIKDFILRYILEAYYVDDVPDEDDDIEDNSEYINMYEIYNLENDLDDEEF